MGNEVENFYDKFGLSKLGEYKSNVNKSLEDLRKLLIVAIKNGDSEEEDRIREKMKYREEWKKRIEWFDKLIKQLEKYDSKILECKDDPEKRAKTLSDMKDLEQKIKIMLEKDYDDVSDIIYDGENKYRKVEDNGKYWLADEEGNIIIPIEYKVLSNVKNWNFLYTSNGLFRWMMNVKGEILHKPEFSAGFELFDNWYVKVEKICKCWLLDDKGDWLIKPDKYNYISALKDNKFIFGNRTKSREGTVGTPILGLIDGKWNEIIPCKYEEIEEIEWWYYKVKYKWYFWLYKDTWECIAEPKYLSIERSTQSNDDKYFKFRRRRRLWKTVDWYLSKDWKESYE